MTHFVRHHVRLREVARGAGEQHEDRRRLDLVTSTTPQEQTTGTTGGNQEQQAAGASLPLHRVRSCMRDAGSLVLRTGQV